jgi:CubicO group peptidase (beta-lactamase class C family)
MPATTVSTSVRRAIALVSSAAVVASIAVAAPAVAAGRDYPATSIAAQQAIEGALAATGATSVTAGLTDTEGLLWQGTAGVRDASGAAPDATTRFGIGSTSKMFATAAVMQLVDQGKVGLDQPVVRYLPQFTMRSPEYRQVTVRMLLDHSAGLPGSAYANAMTTAPYPDYADEVLDYLAQSRLKTTPGAMSVYCNDCFTLAGELVAEVSGMPFTAYVERNLLAPLGMTSSDYVTGRLPALDSVARVVRDGTNRPLEVTNVYASGGLMSTPADMLAFARMLLAGGTYDGTRVLTPGSIRQMGSSQLETTLDPVRDSVWNYGLGWDTVDDLALRAVGVRAWVKGGDTSDYHASLVVAPEVGLAAFVAGAGPFSSSTAQAAAEAILLNALAERGDILAVPEPLGTGQPPAAMPTGDDINAMLGVFLGVPGMTHRITRADGDRLNLETLVDGAWTPGTSTISFRSDGAWWADGPRALYLRPVTGWGRTYLVIGMPNGYGNAMGEQVIGERVAPAGAMAAAWRDRLGPWLFVGDAPTSTLWLGRPATELRRIPGLPGYLDIAGWSPVDARSAGVGSMFLQVPLMFGRDLDDLVPQRGGLLRLGTNTMIAYADVAPLDPGRTSVRIGSPGYGEWRTIDDGGRVTVRDAKAWFLYDMNLALLDHGMADGTGMRAPKDGLLLVFGDPGDRVGVTLR